MVINGCDGWIDGLLWWNWRHCCDVHDVQYGGGGEWWLRIVHDLELGGCVGSVLLPMGVLMALATLLFGWLFFRFDFLGGTNLAGIILNQKEAPMAPAPRPSDKILAFIGGHEGKVLKAYRDPVHVITIGYGFTWGSRVFREWWAANRGGKLKMGDTMTEAEAMEVLRRLVAEEYMPPVVTKFKGMKARVTEPGTSMVYNCGTGALGWNWANSIANGDLKGGIARWRTTGTTAKGKKLPGLVRRRNEEADIAEFDRWPAWLTDGIKSMGDTKTVQSHVDPVDIAQAQQWLETLGYSPGPADGIAGVRTINATRRFQKDHGQLKVDGIIGQATLAALQRAIDLRKKAGTTGAVGGGAVAAGTAENVTSAGNAVPVPVDVVPGDGISEGHFGWVGDVLVVGGIVIGIAVLVYLAWRYKDEINAFLRRLA